jgi:hypothetical protein
MTTLLPWRALKVRTTYLVQERHVSDANPVTTLKKAWKMGSKLLFVDKSAICATQVGEVITKDSRANFGMMCRSGRVVDDKSIIRGSSNRQYPGSQDYSSKWA